MDRSTRFHKVIAPYPIKDHLRRDVAKRPTEFSERPALYRPVSESSRLYDPPVHRALFQLISIRPTSCRMRVYSGSVSALHQKSAVIHTEDHGNFLPKRSVTAQRERFRENRREVSSTPPAPRQLASPHHTAALPSRVIPTHSRGKKPSTGR